MAERSSTPSHWDEFWTREQDIADIYPHSDSLFRNLSGFTSPANLKALEVGGGSGRDSAALAKAGAQVTVVDYAQQALRTIRNVLDRANKPGKLVRADGFQLPFPDNTFDIVFHQGVLEHFREPEPFLRENVRVLKPGGLLLVDVPQRWHLYTLAKHILIAMDKWFAGWETEFSIGELQKMMEAEGVEMVHSYGDWMYPGFFYRSIREALKKPGIKLPMYPPTVPVLRSLRRGFRNWFITKGPAFYTFSNIGIIGRKQTS
jgi:SAM-dependent methyltransferase